MTDAPARATQDRHDGPTTPRPEEAGRRRRVPAGLKLLGVLVAVCVLLELGLRALLFGSDALAERLGAAGLRRPDFYADGWSDEAFWVLQQRWFDEPGPLPPDVGHPQLGWKSSLFDSGSFAHVAEERIGARRPVLFYGDSFAQCNTPQRDCFQGLLERSDLDARYQLLNYGVRAFGLDQIRMLMTRTVERYAERDPVVVLGIYLEDDLDRATLRYRGWPKPWFDVETRQGRERLIERGIPVPSPEAYVAEQGTGVVSYAWRYLLHGPPLLPATWRASLSGAAEARREKERLGAAILRDVFRDLRERELEFFVLLFHGRESILSYRPDSWQEAFVLGLLREEAVPFVSSKTEILADMLATGRTLDSYFGDVGVLKDHYLPSTNALVFETLRRGLAREFDTRTDVEAPAFDAFEVFDVRGGDEPAPRDERVRFDSGLQPRFTEPEDLERLWVVLERDLTTALAWDLSGAATRLDAVLKLAPGAREPAKQNRIAFAIAADGKTLSAGTLDAEHPELPVALDLRGVDDLRVELTAAAGPGGGDGARVLVYFASPLLR